MNYRRCRDRDSITLKFQEPLANSQDYPAPCVKMFPSKINILSLRCKKVCAENDSAFFNSAFFFHQGRYAIASALELTGIKSNEAVMIPAYHCRSLVEPAIFLGAKILFYSLNKHLRPCLNELISIKNKSELPVKALILPHYFGFPQAVNDIMRFSETNNIKLIEDCAHAFYGKSNGELLGSVGHFAISSPRKFMPIEDGGILIDNRGSNSSNRKKLNNNSWKAELKAAARKILSIINGIRPNNSNLGLKQIQEIDYKPYNKKNIVNNKKYEFSLKSFDPNKNMSGYIISRWLMNNIPHSNIIISRRNNFQKWLDGTNKLAGCHALFNYLPNDVVPYVFPLVIDIKPEVVFHLLKQAGVPILRWEDMALTHCEVSKKYRLTLIQLPCHQDLSENELEWMIGTIKIIMVAIENKENFELANKKYS